MRLLEEVLVLLEQKEVLVLLEQDPRWSAHDQRELEGVLRYLLAESLYGSSGDRNDRIERALVQVERSLDLMGESTLAEDEARRLALKGALYDERLSGDAEENQERAVRAFSQAAARISRTESPYFWASVQRSLGMVYHGRLVGDRASNLNRALGALHAALDVEPWRESSGLTVAVWWLVGECHCGCPGDDPRRLALAIEAYESAVAEYGTAGSSAWALRSRQRLADAHLKRILMGDTLAIESAIAAYEAVSNETTGPEDWAVTQFHRLAAYGAAVLEGSLDAESLPLHGTIHALQMLGSPTAPQPDSRSDRSPRGETVCLARSVVEALRIVVLSLSRVQAERARGNEDVRLVVAALRTQLRARSWQ